MTVLSHAASAQQKPLVGPPAMVRLLNGGQQSELYRAGIEIKLQADYKTYWRTPGDSGVPPRFDWSRSSNLKSVSVSYPAPIRFDDSAGSSIGYQDEVILPLVVEADNPDRPVDLHLVLDYAVCSTLCIPVRDEVKLRLSPGTRANSLSVARIESAALKVPVRAKLNDGGPISLTNVQLQGSDAVLIEAGAPADAKIVDAFVEGPDGWVFGAAVPVVARDAAGRNQRNLQWRVPVEDRPGKETPLAGIALVVTIVADDQAIEVMQPLDGSARLR